MTEKSSPGPPPINVVAALVVLTLLLTGAMIGEWALRDGAYRGLLGQHREMSPEGRGIVAFFGFMLMWPAIGFTYRSVRIRRTWAPVDGTELAWVSERRCPRCRSGHLALRCYADRRRNRRFRPAARGSAILWCMCRDCGVLLKLDLHGDGTYLECSKEEWSRGVGMDR